MQPNVLDMNCGSRQVLNLIADRWSVLIIYALEDKTLRYSEIKTLITGISQKMLTQSLKALERNGIVKRKAFAEIPPRVEYSLTELGSSLFTPLKALCQWSEKHIGCCFGCSSRLRIRFAEL